MSNSERDVDRRAKSHLDREKIIHSIENLQAGGVKHDPKETAEMKPVKLEVDEDATDTDTNLIISPEEVGTRVTEEVPKVPTTPAQEIIIQTLRSKGQEGIIKYLYPEEGDDTSSEEGEV